MNKFFCTLILMYAFNLQASPSVDYSASIVEVIVPKPDDSSVEYEGTVDLSENPYQKRVDKYLSIGTAWFSDAKTLVSAAHVISNGIYSQSRSFSIRTMDGKVFEIKDIQSYDNAVDVVTFSLKTYPSKVVPIKQVEGALVGTRVCAPGNALGNGISVRCGGIIASLTPEPRDGKWKEIYYSTPTSPGNSGGPLLNENNEAVGVVVRGYKGESLNIATPIVELRKVQKLSQFTLWGTIYSNYTIDDIRVSTNQKATLQAPQPIDKFFASLNKRAEDMHQSLQTEFHRKWKKSGYLGNKDHLSSLRELGIMDGPSWVMRSSAQEKGVTFGATQATSITTLSNKELNSYQKAPFGIIVGIPYGKKRDLNQSKAIMDQFLLVDKFYRHEGEGRNAIRSLGKAKETFEMQDDLGRHWTAFRFATGFSYDEKTIACTPAVDEMLCLSLDLSQTLSLKSQSRIINMKASTLYFPYKGTSKQWAEFKKMDSAPGFFKSADIDNDSVRFAGQEFILPTRSDSEISIDLRLDPKTLVLAPQSVSTYNEKSGVKRMINLYYTPSKMASKDAKRLYGLVEDMRTGQLTTLAGSNLPTIIGKISESDDYVVAGVVSGPDSRDLRGLIQGIEFSNDSSD